MNKLRRLRCFLWRHHGPFSIWRIWRDRDAVMCEYCLRVVSVADEAVAFSGFFPDMTPTDGILRRLVSPARCMLLGHQTIWLRNISQLTLVETCSSCRQTFRIAPDRFARRRLR